MEFDYLAIFAWALSGAILGLRHYRQEMAKPAEDFDIDRAPSVVGEAER